MNTEEIRQRLARRASRAIVGGFRPPDDPRASWFGRVLMGAAGETWPEYNGAPLMPLCQLNLTEAPYRPPVLDDVAFVSVFIAQNDLPMPVAANGDGWLLRAYPRTDDLVPLPHPADATWPIKPFPVRWEEIEAHFPDWEDVFDELDHVVIAEYDTVHDYHKHFKNEDGTKIGGWPSTMQGASFHSADVKGRLPNVAFALQIDTEPKADWGWGDGGAGYIGRGIGDRAGEWFLDWQCF